MVNRRWAGMAIAGALAIGGCASEQGATKTGSTTSAETAPPPAADQAIEPERREAIDKLFARKVPELQSCWQTEYEKTKDRKLALDLTVQITVSPGGKATEVKVLDAKPANPALEGCATQAIASWNYPEGKVKVPFMKTVHLGAQF